MIWVGVIVGVLVLGFSYLVIQSYWYTDIRPIFFGKVITDPDDPKFDPMQFRFEYYKDRYGNEWDLPKALIKMFPPGTDKAYIDKILVEQAGARNYEAPEKKRKFVYRWPSNASLGGEIFFIYYDENNRSASFFSSVVRYYERNDYRDLSQEAIDAKHEHVFGKQDDNYVESHMRPIRKQYLGVENGLVK